MSTPITKPSDLLIKAKPEGATLTSFNAKEGSAPKHAKQCKSIQQCIYGITCPCGATCAFNNNEKAQRMWIKLHKKKCPMGSTYKIPNKSLIINYVAKVI